MPPSIVEQRCELPYAIASLLAIAGRDLYSGRPVPSFSQHAT